MDIQSGSSQASSQKDKTLSIVQLWSDTPHPFPTPPPVKNIENIEPCKNLENIDPCKNLENIELCKNIENIEPCKNFTLQ